MDNMSVQSLHRGGSARMASFKAQEEIKEKQEYSGGYKD